AHLTGQQRLYTLNTGSNFGVHYSLDFVIPFTATHLRRLLEGWVGHYNAGRPHMALGPGIPQPLAALPTPLHKRRHQLPAHCRVVARPVLGGLHHEYRPEEHIVCA
nr:transposase [Candidatus Tectomicrobia bacterium]